jgi:hypothetical protein
VRQRHGEQISNSVGHVKVQGTPVGVARSDAAFAGTWIGAKLGRGNSVLAVAPAAK